MVTLTGFNFNFGPYVLKKASITLRRTPTTIIVTLTDLDSKVIFSCSTGSMEGTKKFRRSPFVMEPLFAKVLVYLRHHDIAFLDVVLRLRVGAPVFAFIKECHTNGLQIHRIIARNRLPHNGVRSKKAPRK